MGAGVGAALMVMAALGAIGFALLDPSKAAAVEGRGVEASAEQAGQRGAE